jgi:type II secretory pathway pseudopilin PulG
MNVSRRYNLVEVILALGVVAIGVVSIMALFPIGANASRDASMETYAANVADEMLQYIKYQLKNTDGKTLAEIENTWDDLLSGSSPVISDKGPDHADIKQILKDIDVTKLDDTNVWKDPSSTWGVFANTNTIYQYNDKPIFQLLSRKDYSSDLGNDDDATIDFRAIAYIWKEQITLDKTLSSTDETKGEVEYKKGARIIIRVMWPAEIPYEARQKVDYVLEVFQPIID